MQMRTVSLAFVLVLAFAAYALTATQNRVPKYDATGTLVDSSIIDVDGNVGIGTASAQAKLHLAGDGATAASAKLLLVDTQSGNGAFFVNSVRGGDGSANRLAIGEGGQEFLSIVGDGYGGATAYRGNVGIKTTSPVAALDVAGDPTNSSIKAGGLEFGSYAVNNTWIGDNMYYNAGFRYRAPGSASQIYFDNGQIAFYTAPTGAADAVATRSTRLMILPDGKVGIGIHNPSSALHVIGDVTVNGNIASKFQDVAEWVDAVEPLGPGTVVSADAAADNHVRASRNAYDTAVAGVVSPQPGVLLGEPGEGRVMVAQSGRVKVKVDASFGAIRRGDLLVTSPRRGFAMRSAPVSVDGVEMHRPGTIVGKALEALASGEGEVLALLTLQ